MQTTPTTTTTAECDEVNPPPTPAQPPSLSPPLRRCPVTHAPLLGQSKPKRHLQPNGKCRKRRANEQQAMPSSTASSSFCACFCSPLTPPSSRCCCSWRRFWRGCFCGRFSTLLLLLLPALLVSNENEFFFSFSLSLLLLLHFFAHPTRFVFFG